MKGTTPLALMALAALLAVGCAETKDETTTMPQAQQSAAVEERIAGDKERMAALMNLAYARGTFDDALALALKDSAVAAAAAEVIAQHPELLAALEIVEETTAPAVATKSARQSSRRQAVARTPRRSTSRSTPSRNDALDRAESTSRTVNERLDQAQRVRDQVDDARRKIGSIFKP